MENFLFIRWMKISKKRSHFDTQWKNHIRREGKASTTTTSSVLFFCFALHEHLTRARVFHGLEILFLRFFFALFRCMFSHPRWTFSKYHAFSVGATCTSSPARCFCIALCCCLTSSCGRSTQLFFVYCDCFTTTIQLPTERDKANKMDDVESNNYGQFQKISLVFRIILEVEAGRESLLEYLPWKLQRIHSATKLRVSSKFFEPEESMFCRVIMLSYSCSRFSHKLKVEKAEWRKSAKFHIIIINICFHASSHCCLNK